MHYVALATDYDGTVAHDGRVNEPTLVALERARAGARRVILVTGRELSDLRRVMSRLDLFDVVVAENGALLYTPATKQERALAPSPDLGLVARLRELRVDPLSVGRSIIATWEPNEAKVLHAIHEMGLELTITFNKGAVMVLPAGVNKASGLKAALEQLQLSPLNCVAVGDAENDMAFLDVAGIAVAVANAVPALRDRAAWVTNSARGAGVAELIERVLQTDLADLDARNPRQRVALARTGESETLTFQPQRDCLLLAGGSGGGKSTLTGGLTERLAEAGFQFCLVDPEGDYEGLGSAVVIGTASQPPAIEHVTKALREPATNVVVNLLGVPLADRPSFFGVLLPELLALRAEFGRPHFIIVDEAHHALPADWDPGAAALPEGLEGFLFVTTRPNAVSPRLLRCVSHLMVVGAGARQTLNGFCGALGRAGGDAPDDLPTGEVLVLDVAAETLRRMKVMPGEAKLLRHQRKYAEGRLGDDKSFWFHGSHGKLNLRAQNVTMFVQMAEGVDEETWQWHRERGDYSRWFASSIKDHDLAAKIAEIEAGSARAHEARQLLREAIEERYTLSG